MELNPYLHYLATEERRADAMRDVEQWRLAKLAKRRPASIGEENGNSPVWLRRLGLSLRRLVVVRPASRAGELRPEPSQIESRPRL